MRAAVVIYLAVLFYLFGCSTRPRHQKNLVIIDYKSRGEFFSPGKPVGDVSMTVRIVFKDDYRLYIAPVLEIIYKAQDDEGTNDDDEVPRIDTTYAAYVWKLGDKKGFEYTLENFDNEKGKIISVDSTLDFFGFTEKYLKHFNYKPAFTSLSIKKDGSKRIEHYALKTNNLAEPDTMISYYDTKLRGVDFSFSKELDELNKSKLCKVVFISNKIEKGLLFPDSEVPRTESYYEFAFGTDSNPKRLEALFAKAKADRALLLEN